MFPLKHNHVVESITTDDCGRKIHLNLRIDNESVGLINVNAPTKDNTIEHYSFISALREDIDATPKCILGGDFNLYVNPEIDKDFGGDTTQASVEINNILDEYNFIDIWRILHPETKRYTWRRNKPIVQSRLDYWFVPSELIYHIESSHIKPSIKTDHSLITLNINSVINTKRGPGLWKFNDALLKDINFVQTLKEKLLHLNQEFLDMENKSLKWELLKTKIRSFTIQFSKNKFKAQREHENNLHKRFTELSTSVQNNPSPNTLKELDSIRVEFELLNAIKTEGHRIRSRAQSINEGEKCSKYFFNLEKRNYDMKHIQKLRISENEFTTDPKKILDLQKEFYEKLYGNDDRMDDFDEILFDNIPKLSNDDTQFMDERLCMDDCTAAVKALKRGKSPGSDGLTADFYKFFWSDIKENVLDSLQYAYKNNPLSNEQRRAILRLIPKKDKDNTDLKNWRPISLLNTDYKILAHALSIRLQKVLPKIISHDQNGYLKNRFIGFNVRTIIDAIEYSYYNNLNTLLAFLDFEKAFDKINWKFMDKTLLNFGFGEAFRKWIKIMYTDISSCVLNNGYTSKYFTLKCGIRQGCPLSALLFIMAVEILAITIRKNENIKGISLGANEIKITQLADDTTLILKDITSLHLALNILYMFHKSSGLKLNYTKTEILPLGSTIHTQKRHFNLKWVKDKIYALGTWFYKDPSKITEINCQRKLEALHSTLSKWSHLKLTLLGKITIIKSLALSKLNYCISTIEIPEYFTTTAQDEINKFLWDGKPPKIKFQTAMADIPDGGIRHINVHAYVVAQKAIWSRKLICKYDNSFISYIEEYLPPLSINEVLKISLNPDSLSATMPGFYRQVLHAWYQMKEMPECAEDIVNEVIWYNKHIVIDKEYVFYKTWYNVGIIYISDLLNDQGAFMSYEELTSYYNFYCPKLSYISLLDAIPTVWRQKLKSSYIRDRTLYEEPYIYIENGKKELSIVTSKQLYWKLINKLKVEATCVNSWHVKYNFKFDEASWKHIFYTAI